VNRIVKEHARCAQRPKARVGDRLLLQKKKPPANLACVVDSAGSVLDHRRLDAGGVYSESERVRAGNNADAPLAGPRRYSTSDSTRPHAFIVSFVIPQARMQGGGCPGSPSAVP